MTEVGSAVSSSRGPDGVCIDERVMPSGREVGEEGFGVGRCHWSAKGPKAMVIDQCKRYGWGCDGVAR